MSVLMFNKEAVNSARDHLIRLLRLIGYRNNLTNDGFVRRHSAHSRRVHKPMDLIPSHRNNVRKALLADDKMTIKTFLFFLMEIMNKDIVSLSVTTVDRETGETEVYSSSEILNEKDTPGVRNVLARTHPAVVPAARSETPKSPPPIE